MRLRTAAATTAAAIPLALAAAAPAVDVRANSAAALEGPTHPDEASVDVSFEPLDGEPTHSGASVLRGTLAPEA